ncbi:MAG: hypothetical protein IJS01_08115 [Lentisphaeria bacterium]|nr:hypothetical protein [Lentisphaeria bacterium]
MKKLSVILFAVCAAGLLSAYETNAEAYKAGTAFRAKRDYKKAFAAYEEAAKLAETPARKFSAEFMKGVVLCEDKQYENGIAALRAALATAAAPSQKVSCQFHIGYYLGISKKYEEAIAEMRKVRELGKGIKNDYIDRSDALIGTYLVALKKYDEALAAVKDACVNSNRDTAFPALTAAYSANRGLKNTEGMQKAVEGMLAIEAPRPYMFFTARKCAFELARSQKKHDEALKYASEIAANESLDKTLRLTGTSYVALSYAAKGDKEKELAAWKELENCGIKYFESMAARNIKRLSGGK